MDIRTIYELTACILLGVIGYLSLIQISTPGLRGIRWFILGYAAAASGMELIALRTHLHQSIFFLLSNTLLIFSSTFIYWGVADLTGTPRHARTILYVSILPLLPIAYFSLVEDHLTARIVIYSLANAAQFGLLIRLVLTEGPARTRMARYGLAAISLLWMVAHLLRAYATLRRHPITILEETRGASHFILLIPVMTSVMTCLAFLWLAMAQLQAELEQQSHTDALTGLLNRRALAKHAEREIAYAARTGAPLSLLICDLDHFKAVNDRYGHDTGDVALSRTAACIVEGLRTNDIVARLGGEEFVLLLPNTTEAGALLVAERTRLRIAGLQIQHRQRSLSVTASFGLTTLQPGDRTLEDIIHRADKALYQAKFTGRNRVVSSGDAILAAPEAPPPAIRIGTEERRGEGNAPPLQAADPLHG